MSTESNITSNETTTTKTTTVNIVKPTEPEFDKSLVIGLFTVVAVVLFSIFVFYFVKRKLAHRQKEQIVQGEDFQDKTPHRHVHCKQQTKRKKTKTSKELQNIEKRKETKRKRKKKGYSDKKDNDSRVIVIVTSSSKASKLVKSVEKGNKKRRKRKIRPEIDKIKKR